MLEIESEKVSIRSGANRLAGRLFNAQAGGRPVLVTGSWTTVKEQMADHYARKLASRDFTVLTFDFAHFGESEGSPREFEDPETKIADLVAAAGWLADRAGTDSVAGLAVCASAQYMAHAIARGAPIGALATVAAWLHDEGSVGEAYGGKEGVAAKIAAGDDAQNAYDENGEVRYVPAYSDTDPNAAMGEMVKAYYGDPARGAVPEWNNRFAVMSWPGWLTFDGVGIAPKVQVPTVMVHSEKAAFPDNVRRFEQAFGGDIRTVWREGSQLDFYDQPAQVDPAVDIVADHFTTVLKPTKETTDA